ncbi:MAG: DNA translocase FtsK [Egibacteraceae bacterium]
MPTTRERKRTSSPRAGRASKQRDPLRDAWGAGLLILAALAALGLYLHAAGIVGTYLELVFRGLFGVFGLLAPVALGASAVVLFAEPRKANGRVLVGLALLLASLAGLWHLAAGSPASTDAAGLQSAGGWLGAGVAEPLRGVAATWGTVVILLPLAVLGLLIATATPPRAVGRAVAATTVALRDRLRERAERRALRAEERRQDQSASQGTPDAPVADAASGQSAETARLVDEEATVVGQALEEPGFTGLVDERSDGAGDVDVDAKELSDTQLLPQGLQAPARQLSPVDPTWADYELPALELLRTGTAAPGNKKSLDQMTRALEHTLQQFGVDAAVARVARGPTVTRFEISLGPGVKVAAVTRLNDDISYALATPEIRIVAPIPGKSAIGIEVPNRDRDVITLGDVLRSPEASSQHHPLASGVGVDIAGNSVLINLAAMPHLLIAGATGSGKSVTMNSIVTSVLMRATPAEVRMILIDPKRVELNHYEGAPHLLTPVVTDPKRATEALAWAVREMEERYDRLALLGYRNIDAYNAAVAQGTVREPSGLKGDAGETAARAITQRLGPLEGDEQAGWRPLPYILVIIDELADLMMIAPRDVEGAIVRIAQRARAVGIHLVVATQRPSVDVVTGLIKANIPSRIALAMATQADSRTILDQGGAEKLVGHGDMLFMPANASKPHRIQGCLVKEEEIEQVVSSCRLQREPEYEESVVRSGSEAKMADVTGDDASDADLTTAARDLIVRSGLGSTSMLQRKLKIGFARAGRIMDELETLGVVGPSEGSKARQVLMTVEELEASQE